MPFEGMSFTWHRECAWVMSWAVLGVAAYLLGAFPTAYLVGKAHGIDIRKIGSGNVGATNVSRALGLPWAIFTLAVDVLKGAIPAALFPLLAVRWFGWDGSREHLGLWCAAMAIAGHNWPVYLGFRGGKGVATSVGALLGLTWLPGVIALGCWIAVFAITRYVSLGSIVAAGAAAASAWALYGRRDWVLPAVYSVLAALLIYRHRANIGRLLRGEEKRMGRGK